MGGVARPFNREDEIVRRLVAPAPEARRLLRAVECPVDLDRGDVSAGIVELARLRQPGRIEAAAPRCKDPAADADAYIAHISSSPSVAATDLPPYETLP